MSTTVLSSNTALPDARPEHTEIGITGQAVTTRVLALDIFRGFTMAVMIFVNDIGEMGGLPAWTHHYPRNVDAMSYVDMVYPFFLFAVGLALPLAIQQRLRRNPSLPNLWLHIVIRCATLIVLGLVIANAQFVNAPATHMRGSIWALLTLVGAILFLNVYPRHASRSLVLSLRGLGLTLAVLLFALFRRQLPDGHLAWLDFEYPEILGLIGLTYLAVCLLYVPTRRFRWAPLAWLAALVLFNAACCAHWIPSPVDTLTMYGFPFDNGAMASLTMAGIVVSGFFLPQTAAAPLQRSALSTAANRNPLSSTEANRDPAISSEANRNPLISTGGAQLRSGETPSAQHHSDTRPASFYDSSLAPEATHPTETEILARSNPQPTAQTPGNPAAQLSAAARRAFTSAITFALVTALFGLALKPLGISKIRATPSWALWSIAAATLVFALFYYLLDIRRRTVWSAPFRAPGANTLLTYLLPDLFYYLTAAFHLNFLFTHLNYGLAGVFRALCFVAVMLALSYTLTRARLRLQL